MRTNWEKLTEFAWEALGGFTLSWAIPIFWQEVIHLIFVIIGGIVGTVTIHYTRKFIKWLEA